MSLQSHKLKEIMIQQDVILDEMNASLDRLKASSSQMGQSLGEQNKNLEHLMEEVDESQGQMYTNLKKIKRTMERKSHMGGIIGGLSLVGLTLMTVILVK